MAGGETTLYVHWAPNTYTIRFAPDFVDATGVMDDVKAPMGKSVSLPANTFERGGYDFLRWRYTYEGETFYFNNMEAVKDLVPTDGAVAMLFAEWTPKLNTVVFENGDSGVISGVANPQQVLTGSKPSMKNLSVEGLPGYVLLGWDYEMRVEGAKALTGHITDPSDLVILGPTTFTAVWSKPNRRQLPAGRARFVHSLRAGQDHLLQPARHGDSRLLPHRAGRRHGLHRHGQSRWATATGSLPVGVARPLD